MTVLLQMFFFDSDSEISLKIGQYSMKSRCTKQRVLVFLDHPVDSKQGLK